MIRTGIAFVLILVHGFLSAASCDEHLMSLQQGKTVHLTDLLAQRCHHAYLVRYQQLPRRLQNREKWRYWAARSYQAIGRDISARQLLEKLSFSRDYYGFVAATEVGLPFNLNQTPENYDHTKFHKVLSDPDIRKSKRHYDNNQIALARNYWSAAIADFDREELYLAALIAHFWGWHEQSTMTSAVSGYKNHLRLRFPLAYSANIQAFAKQHAIEPAFLFALIRQESSFQMDAISSAGALGFMQILQTTAEDYAKDITQPKLLSLHQNIDLGCQHFSRLLELYQGNYILALAAYNAGEGRVNKHLQRHPFDDPIFWIETLPWGETREYIKHILSYYVIYSHQLGLKPDLKKYLN